uniref:Uncharacterized protein n=1 Tax=viral metagenome TaxID=1070528 RepID=A0A6C0H5P3_9ZZZZ
MTAKIALCFIIGKKHVLYKEHIWRNWIEYNKDIINIYFHYDEYNKIKSDWIKKYSMPEKYLQKTEYFNVVPAYMSLMSFAYMHDKHNEWFCFLTESCCPLISPEQFRHLFLSNSQKSYFKWKPAYWNIDLHKRANLKHLNKRFHLSNDPWFILCRYHVCKCLQFMIDYHHLYLLICKGGLANESIFAIMLETYLELGELSRNKIINVSSTLCNWDKMSSTTSPYIFENNSQYEIDYILSNKNENSIFIRKVYPNFSDKLITFFILTGEKPQKERWGFILLFFVYLSFIYFIFILRKIDLFFY